MPEEVAAENIIRCVAYYDKVSDDYIDSIELPKIPLKELQKLWNLPEDDPMLDCFPINQIEHINFFEQVIKLKLETEKYVYFLETI